MILLETVFKVFENIALFSVCCTITRICNCVPATGAFSDDDDDDDDGAF